MRRFLVLTLAGAALFMVSCRPSGQGASAAASPQSTVSAAKDYPAVGVITGFQSDNKIIVIHHQAVPGLMDEMTMGYELQDPSLAQGLKVGDAVDFTITARDDDYIVTALKKR